uniref:Uncharacterized protein n=1 Tax=Panagrolaimus superbus TaxID=310955 RepID=A0A914YB89_9BILA
MREKTVVDLSNISGRHISYISYYSSSEDDSTLDSIRGGSIRGGAVVGPSVTKMNNKVKENNAPKKVVESNNNSSSKPLPRPRLLRHRSHSRGDPHQSHNSQNDPQQQNIPTSASSSNQNGSPMQRILNDEQRLRKQNKRSSQIFGVEPPIVAAVTAVKLQNPPPDIANRALPKPPPEEDPIIEDIDEDAVYVNSGHCTSTNDSGLGSTTGVPPSSSQDYANTRIPFCPGKISNNIKKMVQNLQVSLYI